MHPDLDVSSLIRATTSAQSVGKFLFSACASVLPRELLGCSGNWIELRRAISTFVSLRKYDSMDIAPLINKMRVSQVQWLSISGARSGVCSYEDLVWRTVGSVLTKKALCGAEFNAFGWHGSRTCCAMLFAGSSAEF
mmetsp:Transcript_42387/g.165488  ORF Transcript_42387/g.165488 Transcript_42387/m.165488 type:complete len:137 (+) Transcript_42387:1927-2337(+)